MIKQIWTDAEKKIVIDRYPKLGASGLLEHLPGKTAAQIGSMASNLGVPLNAEVVMLRKRGAFKNIQHYMPTPEQIERDKRLVREGKL